MLFLLENEGENPGKFVKKRFARLKDVTQCMVDEVNLLQALNKIII